MLWEHSRQIKVAKAKTLCHKGKWKYWEGTQSLNIGKSENLYLPYSLRLDEKEKIKSLDCSK